MALQLLITEPMASPGIKKNLVLDGTTPVTPADSVSADIFFRWSDDPTMAPQYLGSAAAGHNLVVPFDLKGRTIQLYAVSKTADGLASVSDISMAVQTTYVPGGIAVLAGLAFASGTVTGTIANNGGTGTIRIHRRTGTDAFADIQSVTPATTTFTDSPTVNATYDYLLEQDGIDGQSNIVSIVATGIGGGAGTAPDTLAGSYDGVDTVSLTWTNHGGTGSIIVEQKIGFGSFSEIDTLASSATSDAVLVFPDNKNHIYQYRIRNDSTTGYSNTISVFIPAY